MLLVSAFLFNAAGNFALGVLLARALGASDYGAFALSAAAAGAAAVPLLEWLRHAATRFGGDPTPSHAAAARATIDAAALGIVTLLAVALLALAFAPAPRLLPLPFPMLAWATAFVAAGALFDMNAALLRARDRRLAYAALVVGRSLAVLVAMVAAAFQSGEPETVLAAGAAAAAGSAFVAWLVLQRGEDVRARASATQALAFARYGLPLVAAGAIALVQAYANRAALAAEHGLAAAGHFALAWDIGIRIVAALGTAADVLLLQRAVRAADAGGLVAGQAQAGRNALAVAGLLLPAAAGFVVVMPALEPLLVDASFRGPFGRDAVWLMPGLLAWGLMQFALATPFQIAGRTWPVVLPGLVGLAGNGVLFVILDGRFGPASQALAYSLGMLPALALAVVLAVRWGGVVLPWRDLGGVALATAAMAVYAGLLARSGPAWTALPLATAGGGSLYALLLVLLDVGGLGTIVRRRAAATA